VAEAAAPRACGATVAGARPADLRHVLDAAVALIERDGVERATTRRIALAGGVSIGAVYEYFPEQGIHASCISAELARRIREIVEALHPSRRAIPDLLGYVTGRWTTAHSIADQPGCSRSCA